MLLERAKLVVEPGMLVTATLAGRERTFLIGAREMAAGASVDVFSESSPLGEAILGLSVGVAAIMAGAIRGTGKTVVVLSGGNIDPMMMERVISHGLAAGERYLKLRIPMPDRPGQLAAVSRLIADANANVLEVLHTRRNVGLQITQVELEIHIETRGPEHTDAVLERLRAHGFEPRIGF